LSDFCCGRLPEILKKTIGKDANGDRHLSFIMGDGVSDDSLPQKWSVW
jgi:hypothetical protein